MWAMNALTAVLDGVAEVVLRNRFWMTWNLVLAAIPAVVAVPLFRHRGPRGIGWWAGLVLVALFLPNAPYVVTDLVHLRGDVVSADSDLAVLTGVLPVYAAFIAAGLVAYAVVLREGARYLASVGLGRWRVPAEVAVHAICAVGVVLGRVARLNSWDTVTEPYGTFERVVLTLSWRWAPVAVVATFVTIGAGHWLVRAVARSTASTLGTVVVVLRSALERRPDTGIA
jgi:uncharacterized membrane protein